MTEEKRHLLANKPQYRNYLITKFLSFIQQTAYYSMETQKALGKKDVALATVDTNVPPI